MSSISPLRNCGGGWNKTQGSNTITSTSFALKFWFKKKKIDVGTILSLDIHGENLRGIGAFSYYDGQSVFVWEGQKGG